MTARQLSFWHPARLISTWFGAGLLRPAPGTWGTLAALPFAWVIAAQSGSLGLAAASWIVFGLGVWSSSVFSRLTGTHDASEVVIDEVAGVWLALAFTPLTWPGYLVAFFLFRLFDITKPWPIGWADKKLPGGFGIMTDDMIAGLFAGLIVYGINRIGWLPDVSF